MVTLERAREWKKTYMVRCGPGVASLCQPLEAGLGSGSCFPGHPARKVCASVASAIHILQPSMPYRLRLGKAGMLG